MILSKLGPTGKMVKKSKLPLDLVATSISYMFDCVTQYISKDHAVTVWKIVLVRIYNAVVSPLIRPLPPKTNLYIMPDVRCTEIFKYW